jgi:imidazolonepropionase-like amidohydrolase
MPLAIITGSLIDGTGAGPVRGATIIVEGDRIQAVGPSGAIPRDATVLDASAHTVMPGMIDCHVHLMSNPPKTMEQRLATPFSLAVAEALANARTLLEHGFTSVRDAGGTPRGVKAAIDQGLFPGPRVRIAVGALSQTAGHGDSTMPSGVAMRVPNAELPPNVHDGPEAFRKAAREMLRAGADQIKVMTSGGVLSPNDEPGATGMTREEIAAVVYEAHAAGKTVMSHAQANQGIKNAVLEGVESIEHGIYLDDEVIAEMKRRGTFLVPTLVAPAWVLRLAERNPGSMPSWGVRKSKEVIDHHRASFRLAVESGVRIAMGTDMGVGPHGPNAEELQFMVEGGMTPLEAIVATTKTAAECARFANTGTIEPGKRADILAVDGDPLADIRILQEKDRLALIMQGGVTFKDTLAGPR